MIPKYIDIKIATTPARALFVIHTAGIKIAMANSERIAIV